LTNANSTLVESGKNFVPEAGRQERLDLYYNSKSAKKILNRRDDNSYAGFFTPLHI
jgi:hypothetical protein